MSDSIEIEYFTYREACERELASNAFTPAIKEVHLELARRYAALIKRLRGEQGELVPP